MEIDLATWLNLYDTHAAIYENYEPTPFQVLQSWIYNQTNIKIEFCGLAPSPADILIRWLMPMKYVINLIKSHLCDTEKHKKCDIQG